VIVEKNKMFREMERFFREETRHYKMISKRRRK